MNNDLEEKQLSPITPAQLMQISTDVAEVCSEIVKKTAIQIRGRLYIKVEGWQALATAHGCIAGARDIEKLEDGYRAIGELRRISDGGLMAIAEGFVGIDEVVWFGGKNELGKTFPRRHNYAIRAMAQTRAISRVCRSAFAHCVVLIDPNLSTTPAEEADFQVIENEPPFESASAKNPPKYKQEDLVNKELQAGIQRRKEGAK